MPFTPLDSESVFSTAFMSGAMPWAVWTAILSSADADGVTALNPAILSRLWCCTEEEIQKAWDVHTQPDPRSKNQEHEGRRLIPSGDGRWIVVSHSKYKARYSQDFRREQLRLAKRRQRAKEHGLNTVCKCGKYVVTPGDELCSECAFEGIS